MTNKKFTFNMLVKKNQNMNDQARAVVDSFLENCIPTRENLFKLAFENPKVLEFLPTELLPTEVLIDLANSNVRLFYLIYEKNKTIDFLCEIVLGSYSRFFNEQENKEPLDSDQCLQFIKNKNYDFFHPFVYAFGSYETAVIEIKRYQNVVWNKKNIKIKLSNL